MNDIPHVHALRFLSRLLLLHGIAEHQQRGGEDVLGQAQDIPLYFHVLQEVAFDLIRRHWRMGDPIRALTVGVTKLVPANQVVEQVSLFDDNAERGKQEKLETLIDGIRDRHGEGSITLGCQENREIGVETGEGTDFAVAH